MIAEEFIEANQKYAANFTPPKLNRRNIAVGMGSSLYPGPRSGD
jgi:hypothetical protein